MMVVKSNKLINQSYKLGTIEKKLVYYLITQIDQNDEDFTQYSLRISDFLSLIGSDNQQAFSVTSGLPKLTRGLMQKGFSFVDEKGNLLQVNWLSSAYHRRKEGIIDLRFDPSLKPFLLKLKEQFTMFNINNVIRMKSSYSMRLYELLKQYEQFTTRAISLDELKHLLALNDAPTYNLYGNIKSKILEVAKHELADTSDITFDFDEIKEGKRVVKLKFNIQKNIREADSTSRQTTPTVTKKTIYSNDPKQLANFKQREYDYDDLDLYTNVKLANVKIEDLEPVG